jgi:hypothetical protein
MQFMKLSRRAAWTLGFLGFFLMATEELRYG